MEFRGSPRRCGREYGQSQTEAIKAFLHMEMKPDAKRLRYAARCWEVLRRWEQPVVEFIRGMAKGTGLSVQELTLLLLHEERGRAKACTAVGATGAATRDGRAIIGQNWDWNARLYPWSGLARIRSNAMPSVISYGYPGLWAGAGINESGMALVWTSATCLPKVKAIDGIPTYALIAGILGCRNCPEALALLRRTANAGCFIFILADTAGEVWVVEGLPGRTIPIPCREAIARANHYESAAARQLSQIRGPFSGQACGSASRAKRMTALTRRYFGKIDGPAIERFLCDEVGRPGQTICQRTMCNMTIDSLYALPAKRELRVARGLPTRHEFISYHP